MSQREEALQRTEKEITAEKAATLGLVAELPRAFEHAVDAATREWALARYWQARSRALDARHTLIIQREAIGLRNHRIVDRQFREPPVLG